MTRNAKSLSGYCRNCHEYTCVHDSCCNAQVWCEGHWYSPEDYCPDCGDEVPCDCGTCGYPDPRELPTLKDRKAGKYHD